MNAFDFMRYEWKLQFSSRAVFLVFLVFVSTLIYGGFAGKAERDARNAAIENHYRSVSTTMDSWLEDLRTLEQDDGSIDLPSLTGSAMDVIFASSLPQEPLSDFSIGQSDLLPFFGEISLKNPNIRLFSKYEFADPIGLALGNFDISKAILLFLPLILIIFSFDVTSADRDSKRLGLILLQGIDLRNFFWRRIFFRALIVIGVTCASAFAVMIYNAAGVTSDGRFAIFVVWMTFVVFYGAFWSVLIAVIASFNRSGEFNVLTLLGLWVGLTLIVPATSSSLAESLYPTPSRLTYLAEAREVENETRLSEPDVVNEFMLDHPELLVDLESQFPDYVSSAFLVTSTVDEATGPIISSFEEALGQREELLDVFKYFSPTIAVHSLFNEVTGTSGRRHNSYIMQARAFKANYAQLVGPNVIGKKPISAEFFENVPDFGFKEEPLGMRLGRGLKPIVFLLLIGLGLTMITNRQLMKISPVSS
ncbi:MAG: DUF3526 domain-containing protein [Gammaproteobacteria bacterium]|nr:DUF3526 domain-containing protein [Gammaproteobacteria bacterium]